MINSDTRLIFDQNIWHDKQYTQSCLGVIFAEQIISITLNHNIIINSLISDTNNYLGSTIEVLLEVSWHLQPILVFYGLPLSIGRKDLGHYETFLGIIGYMPFPIPLGSVENLIISFWGIKGELLIFLWYAKYHLVFSCDCWYRQTYTC